MLLHQNSYTPLCFHIILLRFKNWEVSTSIDSSKNLTLRLMTVFPAGFIAEIKPFFTAAPEVARAIACWLHLKLASRVEYTPMTKPALMGLFHDHACVPVFPGWQKSELLRFLFKFPPHIIYFTKKVQTWGEHTIVVPRRCATAAA